jgi:hypothetical protein
MMAIAPAFVIKQEIEKSANVEPSPLFTYIIEELTPQAVRPIFPDPSNQSSQ